MRLGPPAAFAVIGRHGGEDSTSDIEPRRQFEVARFGCGNQVVEDAVRNGLMKGPLIAIGPYIEFEGFQFDASLVRDVVQKQSRKIRLPCLWTQAAELRNFHMNKVVTLRTWIWKRLQLAARS